MVTSGFLLALFTFGAIGAFSYYSLTQLIAAIGAVGNTNDVLRGLEELRADVTAAEPTSGATSSRATGGFGTPTNGQMSPSGTTRQSSGT